MTDYKQLYFKLFNKLTDIAEEIKQIQAEAEDLFVEMNDKTMPEQ